MIVIGGIACLDARMFWPCAWSWKASGDSHRKIHCSLHHTHPNSLSPLPSQASRVHCSSARLEYDVYRRTHFFPFQPFWKMVLLSRSLLSAITVLLYPVQGGRLNLTLVHAHGDVLREVAASANDALCAAADCLDSRGQVGPGLAALVRVHRSMSELVRALQNLPAELALSPESMAFHVMAVDLITATSQVGRLGVGRGEGL